MDNQSQPKSKQSPNPRKPVRDVNAEHKEGMNRGERIALYITEHVGSMGFFLLILIWTVIWLGWNLLAPPSLRFDPPTGFVFWLFISNMIQLLLLPLLMIGQNLQGRHAEMRTDSDFEVNVHAEEEIESIIRRLDTQQELLEAILQRLEEAPR